jgi:phage-related protein
MPEAKPIPLRFWRSASGQEPVRDWLKELPREDQRTIGRDIAKVQFGWPVGLPVCRPLGAGLWEVRSTLPTRREARVVFGFYEGTLVALHAFIKKTQRTAPVDLDLARQRLKEMLS